MQPRVGALEEPKHSWQPSPQSTHSGRQPCGHQARRRRRDLPGPPVPAIRFPRIPASCSGFHAPPGRSNLRQGLEFEDKTSCFNFVVFQAPGFLTLVQGQRGSLGFSTCQALLGAELGRMASERLGVAVGPKSVLCPPPPSGIPRPRAASICGGTSWNVWCGILQFSHQPTRGGGCVVTRHSFLSGRSWRPGRVPVAEGRGWGLTPDLSEGLSGGAALEFLTQVQGPREQCKRGRARS